eukprot:m51a1_g8819 putative serine threonine protein (1228) ;mRNA; f:326052-330505
MNCAAAVLAAAAVVLCLRVASGRAQLLGQQPCDAQDVVIGLSVGPTLMEQSAADGFRAAIAEASRITRLGLRLVEYNHTCDEQLVANVERLVVHDSALLVVGRPGNTTTEKNVLELLKRHSVPLVGFVSGSETLRNITNNTAPFRVGGKDVVLPVVVNVRGSVHDEINNVLSVLSRDVSVVTAVAVVAEDTPLGIFATTYTNRALSIFNLSLLSNYTFTNTSTTDADMRWAENTLFHSSGQRAPKAVIVCTSPTTAIRYVTWLAHSAHTGVRLFLMSWTSALDLTTALRADAETRRLLAAKNISLYFTQTMPFPTPPADKLDQAIPLLQQFSLVPLAHKPHSALEGYLTGWFIYDVAQKAVARHGLPLTRGDFLNSVFVDTRTFSVLGVTLGPYGDGGISGPRSTQSAGDACNQGVHEVFMTKIDLATCLEAPVPGGSLKFAGCHTQMLGNQSAVTTVGTILRPGNAEDMVARSGLMGAVQDYGSQTTRIMMLRSVTGSVDSTRGPFERSGTVAVVSPTLETKKSAEPLKNMAVISPMPGLWALRRPLDMTSKLIHLFPSSYDEVQTAFEFFRLHNISSYVVILNDASPYNFECADRFAVLKKNYTDGEITVERNAKNIAQYILDRVHTVRGFVILGGSFDPHSVAGNNTVFLLNSQVRASTKHPESWTSTYRLSVTPPTSYFASTSELRTDYSSWVSAEDATEESFASFFVGKFLSQVVLKASNSHPGQVLTADDIVDAVYEKGSFTIEGIEIGPFSNECKDTRFCCNQGLNTVYVLQGAFNNKIVWNYDKGNCGRLYLPEENSQNDSDILAIILSVCVGGVFILCMVSVTVAIWKHRRVEFFNIRRGELELGSCIGHGRVGSMYLADWHGTAVAVRVIDKKATPKEDQRLIKDEVLLLHKHHHPNLLMLMGFCETKTELLVVTEYMEGGTVSDFLARGKPFVHVFTLLSMAFDVLKGIAYLHSCKPAIVHGSISARNLMIDGQGTVKVSDLWYSNKRGAFSSSGSSSKALSRVGWQPPEVIAQAPLTPAADVYAFGIVLWELIAPPDLTMSSSSTPASANSSRAPTPCATPDAVSISISVGAGEVRQSTQLGPPVLPPSMSPEVVELLESCWQMQPERRPSVFQILRHWSTTFGSLGKFEIPQDFEVPMGEELHTRQPSQVAINNVSDNNKTGLGNVDGDLSDEVEATMASFMPVSADSEALQTPRASEADLYAIAHYSAGQSVA